MLQRKLRAWYVDIPLESMVLCIDSSSRIWIPMPRVQLLQLYPIRGRHKPSLRVSQMVSSKCSIDGWTMRMLWLGYILNIRRGSRMCAGIRRWEVSYYQPGMFMTILSKIYRSLTPSPSELMVKSNYGICVGRITPSKAMICSRTDSLRSTCILQLVYLLRKAFPG